MKISNQDVQDNHKVRFKKVRIIANPSAGIGMARLLIPNITHQLNTRNIDYKLYYMSPNKNIKDYISRMDNDELLCFIGGDGTFHSVVNNMDNFNHTITGLPSGTGNAYAKELSLTRSAAAFASMICNGGSIFRQNIGIDVISGKKFGLFCGSGFHTQIIKQFDAHRNGTVLMTDYLKWGNYCFKKEPLPKINVEIDGRTIVSDTCWVEIFNISYYGGPLRPAPHANASDNLFDVLIFKGKTKRDIFRLLTEGFMKNIGFTGYRIKDVEFYQGREIIIKSDKRVPFHMDGDFIGYLPLHIKIASERLKILCQK